MGRPSSVPPVAAGRSYVLSKGVAQSTTSLADIHGVGLEGFRPMIAKLSKPEEDLSESLLPSAAVSPPRVKLLFLDGMRGLAALYVLLFHLYSPQGLPDAVQHGLSWLRFGHYAVGVFIVLSGYSLMLPVARSSDGHIPGGVVSFFKRRARRILPPYYAAIVCSLGVLFLAHWGMAALHIVSGDHTLRSQVSPGNLVTHLLLIHNWFPRYFGGINGTHWSVAAEWQIYFVFPLLLLPVWRRFGGGAAVIAGLILGAAPLLLFPAEQNLYWACPQYVALFAMGMAGATVSFPKTAVGRRLHDLLPWGALSGLLFCSFFLTARFLSHGLLPDGQLALRLPWTMDLLVGAATTALIVSCTRTLTHAGEHRRTWLLRALEARWATGLGLFSYSIYLMSLPIETKIRVVVLRACHSDIAALALMLTIGVPVTLFSCYLFHLAFERRFMRNLSLPEKRPGEVFLSGSER